MELFNEQRRDDPSKLISLFIVFACVSFLMISTFQWRYDFSSNIGTIRIWQYLLAFFSGGALGVAGLLLQKLTKNDLADISILGVGSLNLIFIILFILGTYDGTHDGSAKLRSYLPLISIASSILGTSLIYNLSKNNNCEKFTIIGIAFQFIFEAVSVVLSNPKIVEDKDNQARINYEIQNFTYGRFPNVSELSKLFIWRTMTILFCIAIFFIISAVYFFRKEIDLLEMNEELAKFYGVKIKRLKLFLYLSISLLVGIESAMVGTVALLGIVSASFSRLIFGNRATINIPSSFMVGGILVLLASFISINLNQNIPIGFLSTTLIAPAFLYLLFNRRQ
ncbi:Ferrichrome ABC transporter permease protein [Mycoplasma haemocanis str. Illinois]|uniref:Ferrichrome ABC transporter permease protein n=1 Tax=Mycoplasma haemocanis (strain Illinois) TaxID=1111676 RepID=H6N7Y3_MYCHN|nr:iron ABC transporter permease [Mycoplasma haemocanis]AEW45755.1 Ferrichrome ABC transporter permease protein [Mycoplasma haemocanis str. Illinois]